MDASSKCSVSGPDFGDCPVPILEVACDRCGGDGELDDGESIGGCPRCGGSGHKRTELGHRILSLVRNNFAILMRQMIDGEMARK
jgi:DnaJ-class molecular chaperone